MGGEISDKAEFCPRCGYPVRDCFKKVKEEEQTDNLEKQINKESKYNGDAGYYDKDRGYYAVSNVDYLGESVTLMYIFVDGKLESIWIKSTDNSYESVYNMALEICKQNNLPVSFEDNTDDKYAPSSALRLRPCHLLTCFRAIL